MVGILATLASYSVSLCLSHVCVYVCVKSLQSYLTLCNPMDCSAGLLCLGKNTGVGGHALPRGSFLTRGSAWHLPWLRCCRQILQRWAIRETLSMYGCCLVSRSCPTLCDRMVGSTPGFPVLHHLSYSNSRPLSRWCHPTILSSVIPFSFCSNLSQHQGLF